MIDFAALRLRTGLKRDLRCTCGSNAFCANQVLFTNQDGRAVSSYKSEGICSLYVLLCACGLRYLMSDKPVDDQENTLIPFQSEEAKEFIEPVMPIWDFSTDEVYVKK